MKTKVDAAKRSLLEKSTKGLISNEDESFINSVAKIARKKLAEHNANVQSRKIRYSAGHSESVISSRNGLRNYFNNNAKKLNPILLKCGVKEASNAC